MAANANELGAQPAHPMPAGFNLPACGTYAASPIDGLTKREAFAMAAMQGIRANSMWPDRAPFHSAAVAEQAVADADALLEELAKGDRNGR